jgi:WD40 repeat protein
VDGGELSRSEGSVELRLTSPGFRLGAANGVTFSPSGRLVGQVGRRVAVYSVAERRQIVRSAWHYPYHTHLAFDSADRSFAVRSSTGAIAVSEVSTGQPLSRLGPLSAIADDSPILAGPTDEHLVEACSSGTLRIRRLADLRVEYSEQHADVMLGRVAHTADRRRWAFAFNLKQLDRPIQPPCRIELRHWPLAQGERRVLGHSFGFIYGLALAPSGASLAVLDRGSDDRALRLTIVNVGSGALERTGTDPGWREFRGFAWSPDEAWLIVGTDDGHALVDGATLTTVGHVAGEYPSDAAFSPDGTLLALGYVSRGLVLPTRDLASFFTPSVRPREARD